MSGWDVAVAGGRIHCMWRGALVGVLLLVGVALWGPLAVAAAEEAERAASPQDAADADGEPDPDAEAAAASDEDADRPPTRLEESPARLSDEPVPMRESLTRPRPLVELGNPFLGTGPIEPGIEIPGGAVWQPQLQVFGTYRTAVQAFHDGDTTRSEWANRLDLFGHLRLTGTERLVVSLRPLDQEGRFTGYNINGEPEGFEEEFNARISTLFFEGDLGEIFPDLDPHDRSALDWGFSIGRQPLLFQEGMLVNDRIDSIGVVRNNIPFPGTSNLRATFLYGWGNVHRNDNRRARQTDLLGIFTEADFHERTMQGDFVFVRDASDDRPDSAHWGVSSIQRIWKLNTSFRYLGSQAMGDTAPAATSGHLLFSEVSWTPPLSDDLLYLNTFLGIDEFASAARAPEVGGPLGRTGILFAAVGLGRYGAPLGNRVGDSVGAALGYQHFFDERRKQIIFEIGGRQETESPSLATGAAGVRYQQVIGQRWVLQLDAFASVHEERDPGYGGRFEIRYEF